MIPPSRLKGGTTLQAYADLFPAVEVNSSWFQQLLSWRRIPPIPLSSVSWALRSFDCWPVSRGELLDRCGRWRCWVKSNKNVPLREVLEYFDDRVYNDIEEVELEAKRIWGWTGFPECDEIDEDSTGGATFRWGSQRHSPFLIGGKPKLSLKLTSALK